MTGITRKFLFHPVHFLALGFGTGCVPKAPGTVGTLVGLFFYFFLSGTAWYIYLGVVFSFFMLGIWLCGTTARHLGAHDHPAIVWDEIVGYLITMTLAPQTWLWALLGFVLFRLLDICKPWPINWLDKRVKGGLGIMLDDVLAGIYVLVIVQIIVYLL